MLSDDNLYMLQNYGKEKLVRSYAYHLFEIRQRLALIKDFTDRAGFDGLDWAKVGDAAKVHADLEAICEFLNLKR